VLIVVAVENVLAFSEITELKNQLSGEKEYLEDEFRTEYTYDEVVGESWLGKACYSRWIPSPQATPPCCG